MYPQASKVGYPDRKFLSVTLCREEDQCPDVHLDAVMEMVLAAHTDAITSPEQAPSLLGRVDRDCASQLALWAPLWAPLPPNCSGSGPLHPHPCPGVQDPDSPTPPSWQPKHPLSPFCTLITRFSCLVCQLMGRDQHVGIRQAKPAPLIGQDILCFLFPGLWVPLLG